MQLTASGKAIQIKKGIVHIQQLGCTDKTISTVRLHKRRSQKDSVSTVHLFYIG